MTEPTTTPAPAPVPVVGSGDSGGLARAIVAAALGLAVGKGWLPADFITAHPEISTVAVGALVGAWSIASKRISWL